VFPDPLSLKLEAKNELYSFVDKRLKPLPKNADGSINELAEGFQDNEVDALRHAYVSGVFTQVYGEKFANMSGYLQEYFPGGGGSSPGGPEQTNMDLWNNRVGRENGKKTKDREELFTSLLKALKKGELISDPKDARRFQGPKTISNKRKSLVVVVEESESGENQMYFDFHKGNFLSRSEFVTFIKEGQYPDYEFRKIRGFEIPVSKRDKVKGNNLG